MSSIEQSLSSTSSSTSPKEPASNSMGSSTKARLDTPAITFTPELNLTTMAYQQEPSPSVPAGIEENVLARMNAFMEISGPARPSLSRTSSSNQKEAWWNESASSSSRRSRTTTRGGLEDEKTSSTEEATIESDRDDFRRPGSCLESDKECSEKDALLSEHRVPTSPTLQQHDYNFTDPNVPKIVARYIYTAERTLPPLPPRRPIPPPTLFALLAIFGGYLLSFIISDRPDIIEYSPQEIKRRAGDISVEAQVIKFPVQPDKVVSVVALLHVGDGKYHRVLPITAKPKRVRELRLAATGMTIEDAYGKEIKGALKALQKMVV